MTKKLMRGVLISWGVLWPAICTLAATSIVGGPRDAMVEVVEIRNWIVGADATQTRRDVDINGLSDRLESDRYSGFLGFCPTKWLILYGTLGRVMADVGPADLGEGWGWGLGLHSRLWRHDLKDPEFLAGRWSIRAGAEVRRADCDAGHWQTVSAAADLHFELFAESPAAIDRVPFSLGLYAGPLYSLLDGRVDIGVQNRDFEGASSWGFAGGVEVYLSHNVVIGLQLEFVEGTSWGVSARYTF